MPRILVHGKPGHKPSASPQAASPLRRSAEACARPRISQGKCGFSKKARTASREALTATGSLRPFAGERSTGTPSMSARRFQWRPCPEATDASGSELGSDIHIRHLADSRPPRVGAVQEQMLGSSGFQLTFVFPQFGSNRHPPTIIGPGSTSYLCLLCALLFCFVSPFFFLCVSASPR